MSVPGHAAQALARLDAVGDAEGRRIYDGPLRGVLAPLVQLPALGFFCSRCQKRIAWWALHGDLALVIATERRASTAMRKGGPSDLAQPQPREHPGLEPWIELAMRRGGRMAITDWRNPAGYPLRVTFNCRCGAEYPTTNTTRVRAFLTACGSESTRIYL